MDTVSCPLGVCVLPPPLTPLLAARRVCLFIEFSKLLTVSADPVPPNTLTLATTLPPHPHRYPGHLAETGFNALHFNQLANSFVKDVRFLNADTAIYFWGVAFSTVQDVTIDTTKCALMQ